jgi:tetratricopeptide (TPR) repeat protein
LASAPPANTEVTVTTNINDPVEILFQIGLEELSRGNYVSAISIFETLVRQTDAPRIQLELARALFLDRRYQDSEQVFNEILRQPELPWTVQENIRAYLEAIDSAMGYIKFGFSLVSDSNPRNFTDSKQIKIAGQPLRIIPPEDNKEIRGVRYNVNGARVLTKTGWLAGYLNASYSDFEGSEFDRWSADLGFFLMTRKFPKTRLRVGLEESYYGGDHLYEFPYFGLIYTPDPVFQFRARTEFKIGQLRVPSADYLEATNLTVTTQATRPLTEEIQSSGELYLEKSIADEKAYSYYGGMIGLGFDFALFREWGLRPHASVGRRIYESEDPFFGDTRRETRTIFNVNINKDSFRVFGYVPEVEFRYDENHSNLDYYSYDKVLFLLNFNE